MGGFRVPPWLQMWGLAVIVYFACKVWAWRVAWQRGTRASALRVAEFLLIWPGMNAAAYLSREKEPQRLPLSRWMTPTCKMLLGILLLWAVARQFTEPLIVGWVGMAGLILMLHFGSFELLALGLQSRGRHAPPLMQQPLLARSPSDFWGRRWNTAFHDLVATCLLPPLRRRSGVAGATMLIFLFSGIVHDLVISGPAGGGYGWPTFYFVCQGGAILLERSDFGTRHRLRSGWRGRVLLWAAAGLPVYGLFHPPFVRHIMVPFFHFLHAL